jgi:hypothetical protein
MVEFIVRISDRWEGQLGGMMLDIKVVSSIVSITSVFIKPVVETWITPKIIEYMKTAKIDKDLVDHYFENKFESYLSHTYEQCLYITTLAFPGNKVLLKDLYVPLTIEQDNTGTSYIVDDDSIELLDLRRKVIIADAAGTGKTTLLRFLFLQCIEKNIAVPVLVELRRLSATHSLMDEIYMQLNPIDEAVEKEFILELVKRGDFIFLLDGYDEVSEENKAYVAQELQNFVVKAGKNAFIVATRPNLSIASLRGFDHFKVKPLSEDEAFELLYRYGSGEELVVSLIQQLYEHRPQTLHREFLTNPLSVALLYKAYTYKPIIPDKKHIFYRQVYDALFEEHDTVKGGGFTRSKHSGLCSDEFHRMLRVFGFKSLKLGLLEFSKDNLILIIREAKNYCSGISDFHESEFVKDLTTTVPLFVYDGVFYRWVHKSIQEYFAAMFIYSDIKGIQGCVLRAMIDSNLEKYINVFDLYYDIDYEGFQRSVTYDLVNSFLRHSEVEGTVEKKEDCCIEEALKVRMLLFDREIFLLKTPDVIYVDKDGYSHEWFDYIICNLESKVTIKAPIYSSIIFNNEPENWAVIFVEGDNGRLRQLLENKHSDLVVYGEEKQEISEDKESTGIFIGVEKLTVNGNLIKLDETVIESLDQYGLIKLKEFLFRRVPVLNLTKCLNFKASVEKNRSTADDNYLMRGI